jgi:glycosyltransferase involved in cell wall biosynthesis
MIATVMKVSIVTPTYNREHFLRAFYAMFNAQTYPAVELLIADDSPAPSAFFAGVRDDRVRYMHRAVRASIGEKRNRLIELATGEVIVFFDDDDYYAPHYVETMLRALGDADFVKLVGWYTYSVPERALFYWDTTVAQGEHYRVGGGPMALIRSGQLGPDFVAKNVDGYGFSFVFRRSLYEAARFPDQNFGEDLAFAGAARHAERRIVHVQDDSASVVHLLHGRTTSVVFPQHRLAPEVEQQQFPGLAAHLALAKAR